MTHEILGVIDGSQGTSWLSDGTTVRMPLLTQRATAFAGHFTISADKARALIPVDDVRPILVTADHAIITVQVMEYFEKNIEPYREFVCAIPVHRAGDDVSVASLAEAESLPGYGSYVTHIAVDNVQAVLVGRDVLGFPKITAQIAFSETDTERVAEVSQDGAPIFTLAVERPAGEPETGHHNFYCYTVSPIDNALYHIPYQSEATATTMQGLGHARLQLGSHLVANELRELGISPDSVGALFVPQYTLVSNRPEKAVPLPDWKDPRSAYAVQTIV